MALFVVYAVAIGTLLWYTLVYLPFPEITRHFSFAFNTAFLGVLSLLSFLVYRQERHFRGLFFQFWVLFTILALGSPAVVHFLYWYQTTGGIVAYAVVTEIVHVLFFWVSAKIFLHYIFRDEKRWAINLLAAMVVFPTSIWLFWPISWNPATILTLPSAASADTLYNPVTRPALFVNILSLLVLLAFFWHKLRTDRPIGVFADTLLFLSGLYFLMDTVELAAQVTAIELMSMTQWVNVALMVSMAVTLILRLKYKSQTIAQYYESQCLSYDPRIGRRIGLFDRFVLRCFFDPQAVGQRVFLGAAAKKVTVKRTSPRIVRPPVKQ